MQPRMGWNNKFILSFFIHSHSFCETSIKEPPNCFHQRTIPPAGTPFVDNQGNSDVCARFALAKALSNVLFTKQKIDVLQRTIMNFFVQVKKGICAMRLMECNETVLYIQDEKNGKRVSNESFWGIKILNGRYTKDHQTLYIKPL